MPITISATVKDEESITASTDRTMVDYETDVYNKPTLDGVTINGDVNEKDPAVPDWAKNSSKPSYTSDEVGAVNLDSRITLDEINQMF